MNILHTWTSLSVRLWAWGGVQVKFISCQSLEMTFLICSIALWVCHIPNKTRIKIHRVPWSLQGSPFRWTTWISHAKLEHLYTCTCVNLMYTLMWNQWNYVCNRFGLHGIPMLNPYKCSWNLWAQMWSPWDYMWSLWDWKYKCITLFTDLVTGSYLLDNIYYSFSSDVWFAWTPGDVKFPNENMLYLLLK